MHVTLHTDLAETSAEQKERLAKQKIGSREGCHPKVLKAQEEHARKRPKDRAAIERKEEVKRK